MDWDRLITIEQMEEATNTLLETGKKVGADSWQQRVKNQTPHCGFGEAGTCCRICSMGPCRITPKSPRGICGCEANGVPVDVAQSIYDEMYDFANYAFNKAHSVGYAVIAYQTAWFKCYYPGEYMAALMTSVLDSSVKISEYIAECKSIGIAVLPPDLNESYDHFSVSEKGIRFGLAAVKNIGRGFIQRVVQERTENGLFSDLEDFCARMYGADLNKRALENLIKCGACDCFGLHRSQMLQIYDTVLDSVANSRRKNVDGQMGLFDSFADDAEPVVPAVRVPELPELSRREMMAMEKETTGLYLSGHPMDDYRAMLRKMNTVPIGAIQESFSEHTDEFRDDQIVTVAGIVQNVKMKTTKNQSMMAYVTLEDDTGSMELLTFSNALGQYGSLLYETSAVVISGRISVRDDKDPQMVVNRVWKLADFDAKGEARAESRQALASKTLYLKIAHTGQKGSEKIVPILNMFPGQVKTVIYYADTGVRMGGRCMPEEIMMEELRGLLGEKNVVLK